MKQQDTARRRAKKRNRTLEERVRKSKFLNGTSWLICAFCKFMGILFAITTVFMILFVIFGPV